MKKIFSILFLVCCTVTTNARSTYFNVRVGGGMASSIDAPKKIGETIIGPNAGACFIFQPNICVGSKKQFVLAPTLQYEACGFASDIFDHVISVPLLFGYRMRIGNGIFFVPKVGPTFGYLFTSAKDIDGTVWVENHQYSENITVYRDANCFIVGPYADLAFEIKRFVIGLNGYYSITSQDVAMYKSVNILSSADENSSLSAFHHYCMYLTFGVKF